MNKIALFLLMLICNAQAMQRYNNDPKEQGQSSFDVDVEKQAASIDVRIKSHDNSDTSKNEGKTTIHHQQSAHSSLLVVPKEESILLPRKEIIVVRNIQEAALEAEKRKEEKKQYMQSGSHDSDTDVRFRGKLRSIVYIPDIELQKIEEILHNQKPTEEELDCMVEFLAELTKKDLMLYKEPCKKKLNELHSSPPESRDAALDMQANVEALRKATETKKSASAVTEKNDNVLSDKVLENIQKNVRKPRAQELLLAQTKDIKSIEFWHTFINEITEETLKETKAQLEKAEEQKSRNKIISAAVVVVTGLGGAIIGAVGSYLTAKKTC